MSLVRNLSTVDEFAAMTKDVPAAVLYFWASWCEPCTAMDEVFRELAAENPKAAFVRVEAEEAQELSEKFSVQVVPFFVFLKGGNVAGTLEGADAPALAHNVSIHVSPQGAADVAASGASTSAVINAVNVVPPENSSAALATHEDGGVKTQADDLPSRLRKLTTAYPVMLFMKGTPSEPRCGFSSQVVSLLRKHDAHFGTFDILSDQAVREGMKDFSQWPTFPQLYVRGEFVGGCDNIKEMEQTGELREILKGPGEQTKADRRDDVKEVPGGSQKVGNGDGVGAVGRGTAERIKKLLGSSDVLLFMKGTRQQPRCGFSKSVVGILDTLPVQYKTFDILTDEAIRQGMKKYSDWPTFPQLYYKGELVGGCDIVKELNSSGELKGALGL